MPPAWIGTWAKPVPPVGLTRSPKRYSPCVPSLRLTNETRTPSSLPLLPRYQLTACTPDPLPVIPCGVQ